MGMTKSRTELSAAFMSFFEWVLSAGVTIVDTAPILGAEMQCRLHQTGTTGTLWNPRLSAVSHSDSSARAENRFFLITGLIHEVGGDKTGALIGRFELHKLDLTGAGCIGGAEEAKKHYIWLFQVLRKGEFPQ